MPNAVITGALERLSDMAVALKSARFDVLAAETSPSDVPDGPIDCYVQLPPETPSPDGTALQGTHALDPQALVARFDAVSHLAPQLAPEASVVLVADRAEGTPAPDVGLVRLLMEAVLADHARDRVRTAVVDGGHLPEEVAVFAWRLGRQRLQADRSAQGPCGRRRRTRR